MTSLLTDLLPLLLLGFSLALDCFAISISQGIRTSELKPMLILAILFGVFQGGMLLLGHLTGSLLTGFLTQGMNWIAAALLGVIGVKMLLESRENDHEDEEPAPLTHTRDYLLLSIATSIDALAAGISLKSLSLDALQATLVVGIFSFGLALLGSQFGKQLGVHLGKRAELFGGLVLIGLGIKSLLG